MARFYGSMQGNRGETTRMGTPNSGLSAHIRGWDVGVKVFLSVDEDTGKDYVQVYRTGGSKGAAPDTPLVEFVGND